MIKRKKSSTSKKKNEIQMHTSYFACSYSEVRQSMSILATVDELDGDEAFTPVLIFEKEKWGQFNLKNFAATSIYRGDTHSYITGIDGEILTIYQGSVTKEYLPDSGSNGRHLGRPNRIRSINNQLYICGYAGQVYTQDTNGKWTHIDKGLAEKEGNPRSIDLEDISGTGFNNLYVVGSKGLIAHWNGKQWKKISALTDVYLSAIHCFSPNHIFIVGDNGTFLESNGKNWKIEIIPGCEENSLSDIVSYKDHIYVAAVDKLMVRKAGKWMKIDNKNTNFLKLVVGSGKLWVMGSKRLNSFDGEKWTTYPDPNNR